jgi:hypothetical protein
MNGKFQLTKATSSHTGVFGEYEILGLQHEYETCNWAWHIYSRRLSANLVEEYLVKDKNILSYEPGLALNSTDTMLIHNIGSVAYVEPGEKEAIFKAIAEWEELDQTTSPNSD